MLFRILIIYDNHFANYHHQWDRNIPVRITLDSPELLMDYLESEDTWAIVPLCVYQDLIQKNEHIKTVPTENDIHRTLYLIYQMGQGTARNQKIKEFIESLHGYVLDLESKKLCTVLGEELS